MNESFLVVLATARASFKEVTGYDRPFYNFFKPLSLEPLAPDEMVELVGRLAAWEGRQNLPSLSAWLRPLIHTAHHLMGGNPRRVVQLYRHLVRDTSGTAESHLHALLDDLTPEYKARWDALSPQLRRVIDLFARMGRAATPTELAARAGLPVNQVNSILKRLREMGWVGIGAQKRRKTTLYQVGDRPFRTWHAFRTSSRSARRAEGWITFTFLWFVRALAPGTLEEGAEAWPELAECARAVEEENTGRARTCFPAVLEAWKGDRREASIHLFGFFSDTLREDRLSLNEHLMNNLAEKMPDLHEMFAPFRHVLRYWKSGHDPEILDRLLPEIRILMEAILQMDHR
jgi:hypothetical protein